MRKGRVLGTVALAALCAALTHAQEGVPRGSFQWVSLNDRPPPAEFPPGSGAQLLDGTLELRPAADAPDGLNSRFQLVFTLRVPDGTTSPTPVEGRYTASGDSLLFAPDDAEAAPPVRFRYRWLRDRSQALTDTNGQVWAYTRQD
jgi:hypothetical protein